MTMPRYIFLRMKNVLEKCRREHRNTLSCSVTFFRKSWRLWDNVEKYGGDRGARNDVTIWRIRVPCWISKATRTHKHSGTRKHARSDTQTNIKYLLFFHGNSYANAPQCYIIRTLPILFLFTTTYMYAFIKLRLKTASVVSLFQISRASSRTI
jgi:hypothetical protein